MKDKYIAANERWAAKRAGRAKPVVRSTDRLPPGQREVTNFPVLDMGIQPEVARADWRLEIHGLVENPVTLDWEQFMALEQFDDTLIAHTWNGASVPV
jgi:DMSO/TMAO reductase YedYZ molybdopterin-dependent catalytic subunit